MIEYVSKYIGSWFRRKSTREVLPPEQPRFQPRDILIVYADELEREVAAALIRAGRPVSNAELAELMGCSKGEASKRIAKMGAKVLKVRRGRDVRLSLPSYLH